MPGLPDATSHDDDLHGLLGDDRQPTWPHGTIGACECAEDVSSVYCLASA